MTAKYKTTQEFQIIKNRSTRPIQYLLLKNNKFPRITVSYHARPIQYDFGLKKIITNKSERYVSVFNFFNLRDYFFITNKF